MKLRFYLNKIFGIIEKKTTINRFRPIKTIYVNFRLLNFWQAIKLPIFIYGNTKIGLLNGSVVLDCLPKLGMIKIGCFNNYYSNKQPSLIYLDSGSKIHFKGYFKSAQSCIFHLKKNASLTFGKCTTLGDHVRIICCNFIEIGAYTQISYDSVLSDSNCHYIINLSSKNIKNKDGAIRIGERNWICNNTYINKGAITGEGCIVASGSYLNGKFLSSNIILAGRPAKLIRENSTRVFSFEREREIGLLFSNSDKDIITYGLNYSDPYEDLIDFFIN